MNLKQKKSAVDLTDLAIGIVVLGIVVSIGATILINVRDSRLTDLSTYNTNNETFTGSASGTNLNNKWVQSFGTLTNATSGAVVPTTNYTTSISSVDGIGTITLTSDSAFIGDTINATYTAYNTSRADWSSANNASLGIAEYGNWFKIIVIVGVAAVVLSLIFMAFGRRSGSTTY